MKIPQFHWSSEIYSLGKSYRKIAKYPKFLPLFFSSDHGVNIVRDNNEFESLSSSKSRLHFTWNHKKGAKSPGKVRFIHVVHPWVLYRRNSGIQRDINAEGTVFYPLHTIPGFDVVGFNDSSSINYLKSLPDSFKPIVVSLHMHDLGSSREEFFKRAGFETISAGDSSSEDFIDNFYSILTRRKYVISESWGSQVAFAIELGIPTQIISREISVVNQTNNKSAFDENFLTKQLEVESEFESIQDHVTPNQERLVQDLLGLSNRHSRIFLSFKIWSCILFPGIPWLLKNFMTKLRLNNNSLT